MESSELAKSVGSLALAADGASSSLYVLRAVEKTADWLASMEKTFSGLGKMAAQLTAEIKANDDFTTMLDPDDVSIDGFARSADFVRHTIAWLTRKRSAVYSATELNDHQRDLLDDCYGQALNTLSIFEEQITELRSSIICHDLAAEPREVASYACVGDLIQALRAE